MIATKLTLENKIKNHIEKNKEILKNTRFKHTQDLQDKLDLLVWVEIKTPSVKGPAAYVTRQGKGSVYQKYVSNLVPECYEGLNNHEAGHLVLQHLKNGFEEEFKKVATQVQNNWGKIEKYIEWDNTKRENTPSFEEIMKTQKGFLSGLANIAQDFEVNTKCFDSDEKDLLNTCIETHALVEALSDKERKDSIKKWAKEDLGKEPFAKGMFPSDFGFPDKLNWFAYIHLMLSNPEKLMKDLIKTKMSASFEDGTEVETDKNAKGKVSAGKLKSSDIQSGNLSGNYFRDTFSDEMPDSENEEDSNETKDLDCNNRHGYSLKRGKGHAKSFLVKESEEGFITVERFIANNAIRRSKVDSKRDPIYNYNRRKVQSVMIPKSRERSLFHTMNVYLLVDCSGSVPTKVVERMIDSVKRISSKCGRNSRVVYWDTELLHTARLINTLDKVPSGGGTEMSKGMDYIRENFTKYDPDGVFFIISDFFDNLQNWAKSLEKFTYKYGIRWAYENDSWNSSNEDLTAQAQEIIPNMDILTMILGERIFG